MNDYPILAQYTIRSKQDYIFRTNRLLEIVGGSAIITESFDLLFQCADECGMKIERADNGFCMEETLRAFNAGSLDMVELFIGGGNETVMYKNDTVYRKVNERFTYHILKEFPGLLPMCVCFPVCKRKEDGKFNYKKDYEELMKAADREKNRMVPQRGRYALPFARTDRVTFQPISNKISVEREERWMSEESLIKHRFGLNDVKNEDESRMLDNLVTKKGDESLLAIVHADGNNMGVKIRNKLGNHTDYDFCVNAMREFTKEISDVFSKEGRKAVERRRDELRKVLEKSGDNPNGLRGEAFALRWLVCDGDDATFICNARLARDLTEAYLRAVSAYGQSGESYSSCAGICIFHSHYPFARAYELAEQACDNAKEPVHKSGAEQSWIDFHYIHSGVGGDLDELRKRHQTGKLMARPWLICGESESGYRRIERLDALKTILDRYHVTRSSIKALGTACEEDVQKALQEWSRVCYHAKPIDKKSLSAAALENGLREEDLIKMLYDLAEVCDLWYAREET